MLLALVAVFAFSVVVASSASAATEAALWLVKGADVPAGGTTVNVETEPNKLLMLEDMEAGPSRLPTAVECEGNGLGLVLPNGLDEQNSAEPTKCILSTPGACETLEKVEAVHLPWLTRVVQISGSSPEEFQDEIYEGTGGNPGWLVECLSSGAIKIKVDDSCTSATGRTLLTNEVANEVVDAVFQPETANCTQGNSASGLVVGLVALHALVLNVLEVLAASLP